ncbi:transposase, Mutator family protein [Yersinia pestis]|nr:transposase, Mutator family protein [Yersinia pestis]
MDEKKLKALAAELAKGLKTEADLNAFSRMLTKLTVETALNAELTEHLGHEKNTPKSGSNTRNGYSSKTLLCDDGEIELNTPRDRENTFEPQLIRKIRRVSHRWTARFCPVRQRHDHPRNRRHLQRDV